MYLGLTQFFFFGQGERGYLVPGDEIIQSGEEIWAFHQTMANVVIKTFDNEIPKDNEKLIE